MILFPSINVGINNENEPLLFLGYVFNYLCIDFQPTFFFRFSFTFSSSYYNL